MDVLWTVLEVQAAEVISRYGSIRSFVMGDVDRHPTAEELNKIVGWSPSVCRARSFSLANIRKNRNRASITLALSILAAA
jgi:hypothetical protein